MIAEVKKSWKSWIAVVGKLIDGPMWLVNGLTITGCSSSDQLYSILMDYKKLCTLVIAYTYSFIT